MKGPIFAKVGSPSNTVTQYQSINPHNFTGFAWSGTESTVANTMPGSFTISKLSVTVVSAPGVGNTRTFTIMKNGSPTSVAVTLSGTATTGTDAVNTESFVAGDTISMRATLTGTLSTAGTTRWNMVADGTGTYPVIGSGDSTFAAINYQPLFGGVSVNSEPRMSIIMPCAGTLSNLYARVSAAPGAGTSKIITLRNNVSGTALTTTIGNTATANSDTTHSVSVAAGDRVAIETTVSGSPATSKLFTAMLFTPTVDGNSFVGFANNDQPSTSASEYSFLQSNNVSWDSTEANTQSYLGAWRLKALYARTPTAAGSARSWDVTVRKGAADTALTVNLLNINTVVSFATDVDISGTDLMSLEATPNGTPTASYITGGILINEIPAGPSTFTPRVMMVT